MDDSVTECNLQSEMSLKIEEIKKTQKTPTNVTNGSVKQNPSTSVNTNKDLQEQLNQKGSLTNSRGNLKFAMLKQAKMFNQSFKTVPSNKVIVRNHASLKRMTPQSKQEFSLKSKHPQLNIIKKIKSPNGLRMKSISISEEKEILDESLASTSNNDKGSLLSNKTSSSFHYDSDIEIIELDELKIQKSDINKNDSLIKKEPASIDSTIVESTCKEKVKPTTSNSETYQISGTTVKKKVIDDEFKKESPVAGMSLLKNTLFVRKRLKPTKIINGLESDISKLPKLVTVRSSERSPNLFPFMIPKSKSKLIL